MTPSEFIDRWSGSGASERSNYQLFLSELCDLLDIGRPDPAEADRRRTSIDLFVHVPPNTASVPIEHREGRKFKTLLDEILDGNVDEICRVALRERGLAHRFGGDAVPTLRESLYAEEVSNAFW